VKIVGVIPARLASIRFPRKILFGLHGLPMIEHVRRRALLSDSLSEVFVATCDLEIASTVRKHGGQVIMTSNKHQSGTSRVAEAAERLDCTHIVLLQGDEPLLLPRHVDLLAKSITAQPDGDAWNAIAELGNSDELDRPSFVKCVVSQSNRVIHCFRRSPGYSSFEEQKCFTKKILGFMAFRKNFLLKLTSLDNTLVESAESIEQMRIIEHDYILNSVLVNPSLPSINEPHEAEVVLEYMRTNEEQIRLLERITREG